ncbi:MAG: hypothetical protein GX409_00415 [candidate division Zixibacteria bacterium]|nr:hypothetical protein [candidate division Zixibacteria bacterium]
MDKTSIIRALAFLLGVALFLLVVWGAFRAVSDSREIKKNQENDAATLDADTSLALVIDALEDNWRKRVDYRFGVAQDPLNMSRTIIGYTYNRAGFREMEEDTEFRLSATVIDDNPKAIIKYQGKSHVVKTGDLIGDGYYVQRIGAKSAVLIKGGQTIYLENKALPAPPDEMVPVNEGQEQY